MANGVFISYRRDGGELAAQLIYEHLVRLGYSVFYDIETMTAGKFDETLLTRIEEAKDFVLILSKNALDRCDSEADWVRREIAHALKMNKNIIPVMLRGFAFPTNLPEDIAPIRLRHGVILESMELFEAKVQKLTALFQSSPTNAPRNVPEDGGSYVPHSNLPSYIANVCRMTGFTPTMPLERCHWAVLLQAMARIETGKMLPMETIRQGEALYQHSYHP